ncbi:MAG: hypothetical protein IPJ65_05860 [Archangiaceae bacterium]|nr:hypothetical protein [Archangiaceae bacterium]
MTAAVLGLSAFFHDSAACLVEGGELIAAVHEERLSRLKHDAAFPTRAVAACLAAAGRNLEAVKLVAFYELPFLHAERVLHTQVQAAPRGWKSFANAVTSLFGGKLWVEHQVHHALGYQGPVLTVPHHLAHAASAYLPSPFDQAAVLTVDGVGEWATTSIGRGVGPRLELLEEQRYPHSLGLFYAVLTGWAGFKVNSGEYKLMGLAPFGKPRFVEALRREVVFIGDDGTVRLNQRHFDFAGGGDAMGRDSLAALLGGPPRPAGAPLTEREADVAASAQQLCEEALVKLARRARATTGLDALCLAGGVALNCSGVRRIALEAGFAQVFVQPAAGDAGGALGAALLGAQWLEASARPTRRGRDAMQGALLGPALDEAEVEAALQRTGLRAEPQLADDAALDARVAQLLADGAVVGWVQGRSELGPRALGARSILADPRSNATRERVNRDMKLREAFRPFAPAVLEEHVDAHFELPAAARPAAPYMTVTARVRSFTGATASLQQPVEVRSDLAAVTHVDGTARLQTVSRSEHPRFHALLSAFHARSGVPVLLNTSFNLRGEPLVQTALDACRTFAHSALPVLVLGRRLVLREHQPPERLAAIERPVLGDD